MVAIILVKQNNYLLISTIIWYSDKVNKAP